MSLFKGKILLMLSACNRLSNFGLLAWEVAKRLPGWVIKNNNNY